MPVRIHVDAASGGMVAPFVEPRLKWDFRCENVWSISTSLHGARIESMGLFDIIEDAGEVPIVCWRLKKDADVAWTLLRLRSPRMRRMARAGLSVADDLRDVDDAELVVRQDFSMELAVRCMEGHARRHREAQRLARRGWRRARLRSRRIPRAETTAAGAMKE